MKKNIFRLTVCMITMLLSLTATAQTKTVILTAGQSNTAGRCDNANLPEYIQALGSAYQYCNWSYTNASNRKAESEGVFRKFWPERENGVGQFAYDAITYYWVEQALKQDFYVVKHAMGGTSIDPTCQSSGDNHWSADPTWLAENASANEDGHSMLKAFVSNIGKSLDAITAKGETPDIKCMIWHQGESDRSGTGPDGYHDNLKAVVKYVRDYLVEKTGQQKYATLPFICGTVPTNSKQYNKKVYDALFTLQSEDQNFHVIETSPGSFIGDQLHFDTNCAERLGIGMYNKMVDLGLISGEKQTVPEANIPETKTVTLDFLTWTKEMASNSTYYSLTVDEDHPVKTIDNETTLYKAIGTSGDADFSEFAETFAVSNATNVQFRGSNGFMVKSGKSTVFSLLNLKAGDQVTITTKAGTAGANSLKFISSNAYKNGDTDKTAVVKNSEWTSGDTYVITEGTQLDLLFGGSGSHYVYTIVITHADNEGGDNPVEPTDNPTTKVTIHTIGDSTMSSYDQSVPAQKGMDGWGDYLADCLKSDWATVYNWADRGETARSYYNGIWSKTSTDRPEFGEPVMNKVKEGDYVIIQFGHNDSKAYDTATYEEWLGTLVDAVKAKGATPIMAGSICRARFGSDGKITRLGRIDTGEDNGVGEDNHDYDYPYHARQVAMAMGIEFIDVTSGVREMFENYGEAKTKALFPSGEKTHTNKLGAQLIAKVAAKLLLETALKNYVDASTLELPAADDIDIVIDNFGKESVVTKKTIWTFSDYKAGDAIANEEPAKQVVEINGLYARGFTNRAINAVASPVSKVTFSDGTEVEVSIAAQASQNFNPSESTIGQNTAGRVAASGLAPTFALNISTPGTFYCALAPTKNNNDRYEHLFFSGKDKGGVKVSDAWAATDHLCELKYHCETTGVIYLAAGITSNFYAMMFVPDMEAGTEEDWNYQMVQTRESGYWTYSNLSGGDQQVPDGLTAYAVSSVENGSAVLTNIGAVIPAGMAVVVKGEPNTEYALPAVSAAARQYAPRLQAAYDGANLLVQNEELRYLPAAENGKTNYYFDGLSFQKATGGETIHTKQAYLSVESAAEALDLSEGSPTAIREIIPAAAASNTACYSLTGQLLQSPVRGLCIMNGKKYIVK